MREINIQIIQWNANGISYSLQIDGQMQLEDVKKGNLREIINEIEKFCRLRFKGELTHK